MLGGFVRHCRTANSSRAGAVCGLVDRDGRGELPPDNRQEAQASRLGSAPEIQQPEKQRFKQRSRLVALKWISTPSRDRLARPGAQGNTRRSITAGTSSTATSNNVLQSHGLTSYRNPRSCGVSAIDRRPPKNTPTTATTTPSRIGSQIEVSTPRTESGADTQFASSPSDHV